MERDDVFQDDLSDRSPLALDQGTLLNDQFRVGRVLGVGGFGITYLAVDEVLEMVVAVKEYLPNDIAVRKSDSHTVQPLTSVGEKQDFEFGLERFLQEARTLAKFEEHDNIVRVRTFFRENGTGYLVMNFYEGRTLAEYLEARNGFLPEKEALLIMEQVFDGLSAVHEAGILHRDIDPNNVYLADNGTVVLLDFGAARSAVGERTQSMSVVLKRGYAPHEQYHSHGDQGTWTDVYACAATLYRALTGYKPPESAARILDDDLAPPRELVPSLSDATNDAVLQGLAVRPEDRPQTIDDLAALLPSPDSDATPGWIGEVTTMEAGTDHEAEAELRLETTHPCRLYVDGAQAAELAPGEAYTLGTEPGSHRLRAVRTDQESSGTATVTAAGADEAPGGDTRMTLDNLVWQEVVSTPSDETTTVEIDFHEAAGPAPGADESTVAPDESTVTPDESTVSGDAATARRPTPPPTDAPDTTAPGAPAADTPEPAPEPEGAEEPDSASDEEASVPGAPTAPSLASEETAPPAADEQSAPTSGEATAAPGDASAAPSAVVAGDRTWLTPQVGGAVGAVLLLLGVGWWALSGGGVQTTPDRLVTMATDTVDVLANDRPSSGALRVTKAGPVPDSVAQVAVVDSTRLRFHPAAGFAGTAEVPYQVINDAGATAQGTVTLQVPFSGERHVVTQTVEQPQVVRTGALGDDDTLDVLTAAMGAKAVAWSEHAPSEPGGFRPPRVIEESVDGVVDLATADLTGNGRVDILSASLRDDVVAWYENQGGGTFAAPKPLDAAANGASAVRTADFDQDGDVDVVAGAVLDQTVTWYENQGDGTFSDGTPIATGVEGLETLHISDLDRDTVPDVLVVAYKDSTINRYEPKAPSADSLRFVERPTVGAGLNDPIDVHTADLFQNGRPDLLAGTVGTGALVLFRNQGAQEDDVSLRDRHVLSGPIKTVEDIGTGDLDGDGDEDILAAAFASDAVVWVQNRGGGTFAAPQPVATNVPNVISLDVADMDRDGDLDIVAASQADNTIGWYENRMADERPQ
jgi:hypothetical protein